MSTNWVTIATFAASTLIVVAVGLVLYDLFFRYRELLSDRLEDVSGRRSDGGGTKLFDLRSLRDQFSQSQVDWRTRFRDIYEQSGVTTPFGQLCARALVAGTFVSILFYALTRHPWIAAVAFVPAMLAPPAYVWARRRQRIRKLTLQLPDAFDVISRSVRAGQSVPAAFQIVADDMDSPIADEFRRCYEQQNLGMSQDAVLRELARRTGLMELQIFVVALLVQLRSGGNIVELLTNLSTIVRKRLKLQLRVRALTGEGRMQAAVLIVLPIIAFGILVLFFPDYVASLIERPELLAATAAAQAVGAVWIRRIISLDV